MSLIKTVTSEQRHGGGQGGSKAPSGNEGSSWRPAERPTRLAEGQAEQAGVDLQSRYGDMRDPGSRPVLIYCALELFASYKYVP